MTTRTPYVWTCGCGLEGIGEAAAQRHVKDDLCKLMGRPTIFTGDIEPCLSCGLDRRVVDMGPGWVMFRCEIDGLVREEVQEPTC